MAISGNVSDDGNSVVINISGRFDFNAHHDFRNIYRNEKSDAAYTIDMSGTEYIDSSALGMLLLLREHAGNERANMIEIELLAFKPGTLNLKPTENGIGLVLAF